MSRWLHFRWAVDRLIALLLILPFAPVIAALALLVRRHDHGPAIVRLTRVGQKGRTFEMLKLRTMRVSEADGTAGGSAITFTEDDRVTPLGWRLRRYRLDELPQLLNVVRGEMALIGPRPETPSYVDSSDVRWAQVLQARPGIAGLTQLLVHDWEERFLTAAQGDGDLYLALALPAKLAVDAWYVSAASPRLDLAVLLALFQRFVRGSDVTALHRRLPLAIRERLQVLTEDVAGAHAESSP